MGRTKIAETWRVSGVSYAELVYRPLLRSGYPLRHSGSTRSVRGALRGATVNKMIFSLFTMGGAAFPFLLYRLGLESVSLKVAVSLSVLLVFGYVVLYSIQILPSFVSSGSFAPLAQLPLTARETTMVAALTLWRTMDYILVLSLATQFLTVAYFTGSALASLLVSLATLSGSLLGVAFALWLTSVFHRNLEGGSMAGLRGLFRPLLFVLWGLGVMSAVFLFSLVSFVAPPLNDLLAHPNSALGLAASLVFPFSSGLLVASVVGESVSRVSLVAASAGLAIAVVGAVAAAFGASRIINAVVLPGSRGAAGSHPVDYAFSLRSPLSAYILKDIRVASRNPATGFLFALPVFEIVAVVVPLTATPVVRMSALLVGTQVGGGFALFIAFLLVTVEDLGVERRTALPLRESIRTLSKVLIPTATYVPVPIALAAILATKPSTFGGGAVIPFAALGSVFAACVVEVVVLRALTEHGRGAAVRFAAGVGSGEVTLALPAVFYAFAFALSRSHQLSIEALLLSSVAEIAAAAFVLRRADRSARPDQARLAKRGLGVKGD
ncbi:MAG: hypothetical protein ABSG45_07750 [Nitrososphaerales archaeon]